MTLCDTTGCLYNVTLQGLYLFINVTTGSLYNVNLQSLYMYNVKLCHYVTLQVVYNVTLYDTTGCFKNVSGYTVVRMPCAGLLC